MWPFSGKATKKNSAPIFFTNTLSGKKEPFAPLKAGQATLYSCGPTVYSPQHIGNMRAAVFADLVGRVLKDAGYRTRRVINITDVGHLLGDNEGDADRGEDRMEKSARESGLRAEDIAKRNTELYLKDIHSLNIDTDDILFPRATDYIKEQIALVKTLEKKGFTYRIEDGIYFDTAKFPEYGKLGGITKEGFGRITENRAKRSPQDFALWKFSVPGEKRQQEWDSPWGRGFPGWHIECSAMSKALLGDTLDVHTGGIEHIPVHHNNEIAQSECASDKPFVRYFTHQAHLTFGGEKLAKSAGNAILLSEIIERGFNPLALRYLFLQAHYSSPLSFTWESLEAANEALHKLWRYARQFKEESKGVAVFSETSERITTLLRDDLGTPQALALLWETLRDDGIGAKEAWGAITAAEPVLGLSLEKPPVEEAIELPPEVVLLVETREAARSARDFAASDELRGQIEKWGYAVEDRAEGPVVTKKSN